MKKSLALLFVMAMAPTQNVGAQQLAAAEPAVVTPTTAPAPAATAAVDAEPAPTASRARRAVVCPSRRVRTGVVCRDPEEARSLWSSWRMQRRPLVSVQTVSKEKRAGGAEKFARIAFGRRGARVTRLTLQSP